jgi:hypothetical protein
VEGEILYGSFLRLSFVTGICLSLLLTVVQTGGGADAEDYTLSATEGETQVNFESGNFSVAITRDWPRVIFWHSTDIFSPTFEVGFPRMYTFNDSDGNGVFSRSETTGIIYLDSFYTVWKVTGVETGDSTVSGEFARFSMTSSVPCFTEVGNDTLEIHDWAEICFWFVICENPTTYENSIGEYTVMGKTELRTSFSIEFANFTDCTGIVLEQSLQGGGSTNMFLLRQQADEDEINYTEVSGSLDQTILGREFTNPFLSTGEPVQEIRFSKEGGVVQAMYRWNTEAVTDNSTQVSSTSASSSYYTTGTGLMLHTAFSANNSTTLSHDSIVGILESGFIGKITEWAKEYALEVTLAILAVVIIIVAAVMRSRRRRSRGLMDEDVGCGTKDEVEERPD